jgi:hypothetical protein
VQEGRLPVLLQELAKLELDLREANVSLKIRSVMHQRANNLRKDQVRDIYIYIHIYIIYKYIDV